MAELSGRRLWLGVLVGVVLLGVGLRVVGLDGVGRRTPDEYTYTDSANTLIEMGTAAGYPVLFARFAADPVRPSPTRVGYHWLLMTTMRLSGNRTPLAGAWLACVASMLSLGLVAWLGWRFFGPVVAVAATLLYAVSPVELMDARRCWEESLVELLALAAMGMAGAVTVGWVSDRLGRVWWAVFVVVGVFCFTVKELSAAAFLLAALWMLVVAAWRKAWRTAGWVVGSTASAVVLALAWTAVRLGGVAQLGLLRVVGAKVAETSPYGVAYESGSGWWLLVGLWVASAVTVALAVVGLVELGRSLVPGLRGPDRVQQPGVLLGLTMAGAVFVGLAMVLPEKLNLRLISVAMGPLALLAGVGFARVLGVVQRWLPATEGATLTVLAWVFLGIAAGLDYGRFTRVFAATDMQDLSIRMVIEAGGRTMPTVPAAVPAEVPQPVVDAGTPADAAGWVVRSAQLAGAGRNEEAIAAAQQALVLDPRSAVAWNNIAAANENLQRWDAAIEAAQRALELQPDFPLAKNNLAWSVEQKGKAGR